MDLEFEAGFLYPPVFTDGYFHGVCNRRRNEVHLALEDAGGHRRTLILTGVRASALNGFTEYNIIGDIYFRRLDPDGMRAYLEKLGLEKEASLKKIHESQEKKTLYVMGVFPCLGGEFLALCERIRVVGGDEGAFAPPAAPSPECSG